MPLFKKPQPNAENDNGPVNRAPTYKIAIIDDEPEVHEVTRFVLSGFEAEGRRLTFLSAFSAKEARELFEGHDDIALAFVDVVMESDDAGLQLVRYVREELSNRRTRLVLRTGQPGQAPEEAVIRDFDINDYKAKTELTASKLKTCVFAALRSYRDIVTIEESREGMRRVLESSASVLKSGTLPNFGTAVLNHTLHLLKLDSSEVFLASRVQDLYGDTQMVVLAATGDEVIYDRSLSAARIPKGPRALLERAMDEKTSLSEENAFVGFYETGDQGAAALYCRHDSPLNATQRHVLELFASNVILIFGSLTSREDMLQTQRELMLIIGDAIEQRSKETGAHVRRVAVMCGMMAEAMGMDASFVETLRYAAPLHDLGKIGIPERILHKPGKLDAEEWSLMKTHAELGYTLLAGSERIIAKMGARIALSHHEKWDGSGYPSGLAGEAIPLEGRIMAVVDVIDALASRRSYKEPWPDEQIKDLVRRERGRHFDPALADLALELFDQFVEVRQSLPDEPDARATGTDSP